MLEDDEASKSDVVQRRNKFSEGILRRSKQSEIYFGVDRRIFRLPVLSNDQDKFNMYDGILPIFCNRSDIFDPYVKFK